MHNSVKRFVNDDASYLQWVQEHVAGFIVNVDDPNAISHSPMVHRATHKVMSTTARENYASGGYIKACSESFEASNDWALSDYGRPLVRCMTCMPSDVAQTPLETPSKVKRKRVDGQVTGLAGELFVAAELLKRGLQTSITFGNAKAIDLLAYNPDTDRTFTVQVKSVRKRSVFLIAHHKCTASHVYVFVVLNKPGDAVEYFVVPGAILVEQPERFTKWFLDPKLPGFNWKVLRDEGFAGGWDHFLQPAPC